MDMSWSFLVIILTLVGLATSSKVEYSVECSSHGMDIWVWGEEVEDVQLEKWGKLKGCESERVEDSHHINLPIAPDLPCGTTRVRNKLTGAAVYYHRVGITFHNRQKRVILVKCAQGPDNSTISNIVKRDVLPPEFVEPDYIEITSEVSGTAPIPILGVGVRQNGALVDGQINVVPGTPLTMEVFLDDDSASTYGILVSYMEVTDTNDKQETIVYNGCSLDSYLFENFITDSGDYLAAKFRAFKFPESSYVLFQGTVDVCLDKCQGIQCSNGQEGFGRKRRSVSSNQSDPNKIFEVTMKTFIKFEEAIIKPEMGAAMNQEETNFKIKNPFPYYEDFQLRKSKDLEAPLLRREPPTIFFSSASSDHPTFLLSLILLTLLGRL